MVLEKDYRTCICKNKGEHMHFPIDPILVIIDGLDIVLGSFSNCIDDKMQRQKENEAVMVNVELIVKRATFLRSF